MAAPLGGLSSLGTGRTGRPRDMPRAGPPQAQLLSAAPVHRRRLPSTPTAAASSSASVSIPGHQQPPFRSSHRFCQAATTTTITAAAPPQPQPRGPSAVRAAAPEQEGGVKGGVGGGGAAAAGDGGSPAESEASAPPASLSSALDDAIRQAGGLASQGKLPEAKMLLQMALSSAAPADGSAVDATSRAVLCGNIAKLCQYMGQVEEAEGGYRDALAAAQEAGAELPVVVDLLNGLAELLQARGEVEGAEQALRAALDAAGRVLPVVQGEPQTLGPTARTLSNLGSCLSAAGRHADARVQYEALVQECEAMLGPHPGTADALSSLASCLEAAGDMEGAEGYARRSADMCEEVLGGDHPRTVGALNGLAGLLQGAGKLQEAEALFRRALAACDKGDDKEQGGGDPADRAATALLLSNLGSCLRKQGNLAGAESALVRSVAICEQGEGDNEAGPDEPFALAARHNLAEVLSAQGKYGESEVQWRALTGAMERLLGPEHEAVGKARAGLEAVLQAQQQGAAAGEATA